MTALYDYYELAHPEEGVGSGFNYRTVPHVTLKSIANNEPPEQETLYDQPLIDKSRARVSGPFTVEAVPAPTVKSISDVFTSPPAEEAMPVQVGLDGKAPPQQVRLVRPTPADTSVARSGATVRHAEWRDELLKTGIRGKGGQKIEFARVEPLSGTRWIHADAETKEASRSGSLSRSDRKTHRWSSGKWKWRGKKPGHSSLSPRYSCSLPSSSTPRPPRTLMN